MRFQDKFLKAGFKKATFNFRFFSVDWEPNIQEKLACWEMYVELNTRVATQKLEMDSGIDASVLSSLHSMFETTREVLKKYGPDTFEFSKLAFMILNDVLRPFLSKWHGRDTNLLVLNSHEQNQFRKELMDVQEELIAYVRLLADLSGIQELT
jgi:hypothetical protein